MKILITTDTYYPHVNGASIFTQRLAACLQKRGHKVLVICPSQSAKNGYFRHMDVEIFGISSLPVFFYRGFRIANPFFIKSAISKTFADFQPDILHVQGHFTISKAAIGIAQSANIPIIGTNHFMPENLIHYFFIPKFLQKTAIKIAWNNFKSVFEKIDFITTPTQPAADLLYKYDFSKKVHPISCGIDLEKFNPKNNADYLKKRYKLPKKPTLLYLGRLDKEKSLDLVLNGYAQTTKKIDSHFVIAGKGAEMNNLKQLANDLKISGRVTFTGYIQDEDLPHLYPVADCFVIAGSFELQSIVTMEAMASGLPVIAVDAVALPELVKHHQNGFLFAKNDLKSLALYITEILSNSKLQNKMSQESQRMIQEHDIKKTVNSYIKIYQKLIEAN